MKAKREERITQLIHSQSIWFWFNEKSMWSSYKTDDLTRSNYRCHPVRIFIITFSSIGVDDDELIEKIEVKWRLSVRPSVCQFILKHLHILLMTKRFETQLFWFYHWAKKSFSTFVDRWKRNFSSTRFFKVFCSKFFWKICSMKILNGKMCWSASVHDVRRFSMIWWTRRARLMTVDKPFWRSINSFLEFEIDVLNDSSTNS